MPPALPSADLWGGVLLAVPAGYGAWLDWRERRLPNWLCAVTFVAGVIVTTIMAGPAALPAHLGHAGLALLVGMALFAPGLIGGGDAKFYAAVAVWFPLTAGFRLLFLVALAGLVLTLALWWLVWRPRGASGSAAGPPGQPRTVPYGVAIAAGALAGMVW